MGFDRNHPMETNYRAKLGLRIFCFILATVGIGLGGYSWRTCFAILPALIVSWIWNLANIIRRLVAPTPVHPGANVALDLLLWLGFGIGMIISWIIAVMFVFVANNRNFANASGSWYYSYINNGSDNSCTYTNGVTVCNSGSNVVTTDSNGSDSSSSDLSSRDASSDYFDRLLILGRVGEAASAMATLLLIFHFVLFVIACVDTHRRRHPQKHPEYSREGKTAAYSYPTQQTAYQPVQQPAYNTAPQQGY